MVFSFPSSFCTDGGRAINNFDDSWPETLTGFAKVAHETYEAHLKAQGFKIRAEVLNFPGGIPERYQCLVFDNFARRGVSAGGGAGLGLAICREIMGKLGGSIGYLPGQGGAGFRITLPVQAAARAA